MKTKRIDYKLIGKVIVGVIAFICVLHLFTTPKVPTELRCGKVLSHSKSYVIDEDSPIAILTLNVDFGDKYYKSINVSEKTYNTIKDGEKLCHQFPIEVSIWFDLMNIIGLIVIITMIVYGAYIAYNIFIL